ncbi:MAG: tetratricopeptide repeat protein [Isosphaeraceae bacterium]|nr:tetratricopeptide repeat protein [Isosphaeraceae bacterium]
MDKKEYDIAVADFTDVIRLKPSSPIGYTERGLAWERKGDFDRALADFNESLRHDPNDAWTYNNRGNVWSAKRELDKAIADYGEALRLDPDFTWAYINRALARGAKRDYDHAIADLDRAVARDPRNAYAFHDRALFEERKQDYAKAAADYAEALRIEPKNRAARLGLAFLLATCPDATYRNGPQAVLLATEAFATADEQDEAVSASVLAASFAEAGDYPRAVEWQEKAIRLLPDSAGKETQRARLGLYQAHKPFHRDPGN